MVEKYKVIIVGAGFAGVHLIHKLDVEMFDILLIDKINYHQFQPLFYQVATSQIEPSSISFPIRNVFKKYDNVQIRLAEVKSVNPENKSVTTDIGDFNYDYLILGMGCKTNFFGNAEIARHAFTLKTTYDAINIRNHILQTFEDIISADAARKEALLNLIIVGAGPTGVELAGAFAEIRKNILPKDYHGIDFSDFKIILVEGSKNTLNSMSDTARKASRQYLENMGVSVLTETFVKNYNGEVIEFSDGSSMKTKTVIWAAGVTPNMIAGLDESVYTTSMRIKVDRMNRVVNHNDVFAVGDIAYMETSLYPGGHPQLANVAINQAKYLASNLKNIILGKAVKEYEYKDLGTMATIGTNKAVVDFNFIKFKGYFAWLIWMFLHLMLILSVKNKLFIFINWAFAYITKDTSLRLILKDNSKS